MTHYRASDGTRYPLLFLGDLHLQVQSLMLCQRTGLKVTQNEPCEIVCIIFLVNITHCWFLALTCKQIHIKNLRFYSSVSYKKNKTLATAGLALQTKHPLKAYQTSMQCFTTGAPPTVTAL